MAPSKKMKAKRSIERAISSFEPCFLLLYISSAAPRNQNHKNAPLGLPPFGGAPTLTNHSRKHRCHHMHVGVAPQPDMWKLHPGHMAMASRPDMCKCHHMRKSLTCGRAITCLRDCHCSLPCERVILACGNSITCVWECHRSLTFGSGINCTREDIAACHEEVPSV